MEVLVLNVSLWQTSLKRNKTLSDGVFCNVPVGALYDLPYVVFKVLITGPKIFFV